MHGFHSNSACCVLSAVLYYLTHTSIASCLGSRLTMSPILQMKISRYMGVTSLAQVILMIISNLEI